METVGSNNNFGKQTQDLADKAAEKVQSGIRTAKDTTNQVADRLSDTVEAARSSAGPRIAKAAGPSAVRRQPDNRTHLALRPEKCAPRPRTWVIALFRIHGTTRSRRFSFPPP